MEKFNGAISVLTITICLMLITGNVRSYDLWELHNYLGTDNYYIYAYDDIDGKKTKCGNYYIYTTDKLLKFQKKFGEEVSFTGTQEDIYYVINFMNFKLSFQDYNFDYNVYGYSERIKSYIMIDGNKVNLQIVYNGGEIKIGSPLILGFY